MYQTIRARLARFRRPLLSRRTLNDRKDLVPLYRQFVKRGDLSFEFTIEFLETAFNNITHLGKMGSAGFNCAVGEAPAFVFPHWVPSDALKDYLKNQRTPDLWGDIYAFS